MNRSRGFTLVELMVVLVIVAILAAIAYPSYRDQVVKTRRSDAKAALMDAAQRLERCYTEYNAYNHTNCTFSGTSAEGYYSISVSRTATTFTLTATPLGVQTNDTDCTSFTLSHTNAKGATGADSANCW